MHVPKVPDAMDFPRLVHPARTRDLSSRRLRADQRTARIPVVMISADATPRTIDRLRAQGADAYLTKPLDVDEFLSTIDRLLPAAS